MSRWLGIALLLAIIVASLGWGAWFSPYCAPEQQSEAAKTNQTAEKNCSTLDGIIFRAGIGVFRATGSVFHTYHDDVNAIGTIVIAIFTTILGLFTISLSKSTKNAARTAELALLSVEIPYLYPFIREHGIQTEVIGKADVRQIRGFQYGRDFIKYYFRNYGRTPAEIIEVNSQINLGMGRPTPINVPERSLNRLSGVVVTTNGDSEDFPCDFTEATYQAVYGGAFKAQRDIFWFSGYVRYIDVFDNEYVRGFCLAFSPTEGKFYPIGGDGFNFRRKTRTGGQIGAQ